MKARSIAKEYILFYSNKKITHVMNTKSCVVTVHRRGRPIMTVFAKKMTITQFLKAIHSYNQFHYFDWQKIN